LNDIFAIGEPETGAVDAFVGRWLVGLNHQRAAEEALGSEMASDSKEGISNQHTKQPIHQRTRVFVPKTLQEQVRAVREQLLIGPMDAATLAGQYRRTPEKSVVQVLEALTELGMVRVEEGGWYRLFNS